ncbi:PTS lactose/cellobiose transporter subunit IIA [Gottfriedia acidiceleris]|uniref:PTS lactose/cellobiose transporter subunit IIA n=1 Tax=Gottfriedia acidiceleris TaxID=371036 RepID=UPI000B42D0E1|nr:PTS lactose/cellobiose transporter subunit IIA [Gottfriedia acidiceleris]
METSLPISFQIILHGGNARSLSLEAIRFAKNGKMEEALESLKQAKEELGLAHQIQTTLIQDEAADNKTEINLLLVHAQDHLMNAITVRELAEEFISLYKKIDTMQMPL